MKWLEGEGIDKALEYGIACGSMVWEACLYFLFSHFLRKIK